jgi:hypothetical protein
VKCVQLAVQAAGTGRGSRNIGMKTGAKDLSVLVGG